MPRRPEPRHLTALAAALSVAWLGGCSLWSSRPAGDDEPTLRSLAERTPPAIQTGKLRPICVASSSRVPSLPELPTAIELGLTSLQIDSSMGLVAPPRTPQPIVDRLAEALRRAVDGASYTDAAARAGNERYFHDAAAFRQWLAGDFERWGNVIRQANIKVS